MEKKRTKSSLLCTMLVGAMLKQIIREKQAVEKDICMVSAPIKSLNDGSSYLPTVALVSGLYLSWQHQ